ncbi:TPA: hypothetical protein L4T57_002269 [Pseudomonas aeruginosa]|nr:hypothetical protein [Pseudomonas aeruginosa]
MSNSRDPLASLTQSLSEDFEQLAGDNLRSAIEEREEFLANIPLLIELTHTQKVYRVLIFYAVMMFGLTALCIFVSETYLISLLTLSMAMTSMAGFWVHRDSGKTVQMRLSHTQMWFRQLDAPVDLSRITEIRGWDKKLMIITFTFQEGTALPNARNPLGPLMPRAQLKRLQEPQLQIKLLGLDLDGEFLMFEQLMDMLHRYCQAAHVRTELQVLKAQAYKRL